MIGSWKKTMIIDDKINLNQQQQNPFGWTLISDVFIVKPAWFECECEFKGWEMPNNLMKMMERE